MTSVFKEKCSSRGEVTKQLSSTKFLASDNPGVFHGRLYRTCPPAPVWTKQMKDDDYFILFISYLGECLDKRGRTQV